MPTVTINIAGRGTGLSQGGSSAVGHMWYELNAGAGATSESYGFAPGPQYHGEPFAPGGVYKNDSSNYQTRDHSRTIDITQDQYDAMKSFGENPANFGFDMKYNGLTNSCIDFTWKGLEVGGLNPSGFDGNLWPTHNNDDVDGIGLPSSFWDQWERQLVTDAIKTLQNLSDGANALLEKLRATFNLAENQASPIILDLDRDGVVETTPRDAAGTRVFFDLDNSGYAERSGWVGADDGLLVRDLNANGQIDSGAELFGNHTMLANGTRASNGFQALAELDTNHDGLINSYDAEAVASLRVWRDADGDGQTDAGELLTFEQAGVQALNVGYTDHGTRTPLDPQGNQHRQTGSYVVAADGSTRSMNDVWFSVQPSETVDLNPVPVSVAIAALPNWAGMGNLPSLHQAMARDTGGGLKLLVEQWIAAGSQARDELLEQIVYHWAGVEDLAPDSRGSFMSDGRKLDALEKTLGERYEQGGWDSTPGPHASAILNQAFNVFKSHLNRQLLTQTDWKPLLDSIALVWSAGSGGFQVNVSAMVDLFRDGFALNPVEGLQTVKILGLHLAEGGEFADQVLEALRLAGESETGEFGLWLQCIGYSMVTGTDASDRLFAQADDVIGSALVGRAGHDHLTGGLNEDMFVGGKGNDTLCGGSGDDVYVFNLGDGADRIADADYLSGNLDTLRLGPGLSTAATQVIRSADDLVLRWTGNAVDAVTIERAFHNSQVQSGTQIESVVFNDGTVWTLNDLMSRLVQDGSSGGDMLHGLTSFTNHLRGLEGNDTLYGGDLADVLDGGSGVDALNGYEGPDTLTGGPGGDTLDGGTGNDTYYFNLGDGADKITDYDATSGNLDTLRLGAGLTKVDTQVIRSADDLVLRWTGNAVDAVTIEKAFHNSQVQSGTQIESVVFNEGIVWTLNDLMARLVQDGSSGSDMLHGLSSYANRLRGMEGNDTLIGGEHADVLEGGTGGDTLNGNAGADTLTGGQGGDTLDGGTGNDTYIFNLGDGADRITDYDSTIGNLDTLRLGAGLIKADTQVIRNSSDLILRWAGNANDSVTIKNAFSYSQVQPSSWIESVVFIDGTVWTVNDLMARTMLDNSTGGTTIYGSAQADALSGGAGDDVLIGQGGADTLGGGKGGDTLDGGAGNDTYIFNQGDGADKIADNDSTMGNLDTLRLGSGLLKGDTQVIRSNDDLMLRWAGNANDSVTIRGAFYYSQVQTSSLIESVAFEGGTPWSLNDLIAKLAQVGTAGNDYLSGLDAYANRQSGLEGNDTLYGGAQADVLDGGAGDDTLTGNAGADTLRGGQGSDTLRGGAGNDTYLFNIGDGADTISDDDATGGAFDTLRLGAELFKADTQVIRNNDDLMLRWSGNANDSVTIRNAFYFSQVQASSLIESVAFQSDAPWSLNDLMTKMAQVGSAGNDYLSGLEAYANRQSGLEGNDTLYGGAQADVLDGGAGDDSLDGGAGADTLTGGHGSDTLSGGAGNDTYLFNLGDGADIIADNDSTGGNLDTLRLGAGLFKVDTQVVRNTDDLVLRWAGNPNDSVTIRNAFAYSQLQTSPMIESVLFHDGTVWTLTDLMSRLVQDGAAGNDVLTGLSNQANRLRGFGGNDSLSGGDQADVIEGGDGNDNVSGGAGGDTLTGDRGADTLRGGSGNDRYVFNSGDGVDTVIEQSGDQDILHFGAGLSRASMQLVRDNDNLVIRWAGNASDSVTVVNQFSYTYGQFTYQVESVVFQDGSVVPVSELLNQLVQDGTAANDTMTGLDSYANHMRGLNGNDILYGGAKSNVLDGGAGDDTLVGNVDADTLLGGTGSDVLLGSAGNDIYVFNQGDGADRISDEDGNQDTLRLGAGLLSGQTQVIRSGNDIVIRWAGNAIDSVTIQNALYFTPVSTSRPIEAVVFSDLTSWSFNELIARLVQDGTAANDYLTGLANYSNRLRGLAGNDTLSGGSMADEIDGGGGSDSLYGGLGNDVYIFGAGYGHDTISDADSTTGNLDTLRLGNGLTAAKTEVLRNGSDLVLRWTGFTTDSVTIKGVFSGSSLNRTQIVEEVQFADGITKWDLNRLMSEMKLDGTASNDTLTGLTDFTNRMNGLAGNDTLTGAAQADVMDGGSGDDVLDGGAGSDTLIGGPGVDTLTGGLGGDTYVFNKGDGKDTIHASTSTGSVSEDVLQLGAGITPGSTLLARSAGFHSYDLTLNFGNGDEVTLKNYFLDASRLKTIAFADGTLWDYPAVAILIVGPDTGLDETLSGTPGDDVLDGRGGKDNLIGWDGNDTLIGGSGNDNLQGNAGDDRLDGGTGDDGLLGGSGADELNGGSGNDTLMGQAGNDRYLFAAGHGTDIVSDDGGIDRFVFGPGILASQLTASRIAAGDWAQITLVTAPGDTVVFMAPSGQNEIEQFEFADGSVLGAEWINALLAPTPYGTSKTLTFQEDSARTVLVADLGFSSSIAGDTLNTVRIDSLPQAGSLRLNGNLVSAGQIITAADVAAGHLVFRPVADAHGNAYANLTFSVSSQNGKFDPTPNTLTFKVTPVNDAPVLTGASAVLQAGIEDMAYTITQADLLTGFSDVDGDTLSVANLSANHGSLSAFSVATQSWTYRPDADYHGPIQLSHKVSDGTTTTPATQSFALAARNDAPNVAAALQNQSVNEDAAWTFAVPAGTFTDVDAGDTLIYSAAQSNGAALPAWLSFDAATRTFTGTPANAQVGALQLRVTATDAAGAAIASHFTVNVLNVNDAPTVSAALPAHYVNEDATWTYTVPAGAFTDVDPGDLLAYSATQSNGSPLPAWLSFNAATRTFTGTPGNGEVGSVQIKVMVTDAAGATAFNQFTVHVANVNDAPTVAAALHAPNATEDTGWSYTVPVGSFTDVDAGETLSYSATQDDGSALPAWLSFDAATRTFSGTPTNAQVGDLQLRVTATDAAGATGASQFTVNVANVNDAPTVAVALQAQNANEDSVWSYTVPAGTFTEVDAGDTLTYNATQANGSPLPIWLSFNAATRTFSGTPDDAHIGALQLLVTVTDAAGATATSAFTASVVSVNDVPTVVNVLQPQAATEDTAWSHTLAPGGFADADAGDSLSYSASLANGSPLPSWLSFNPTTLTFSGTPGNAQVGTLQLKVTATDTAGASASTPFTVQVANVNDAPELTQPLTDQAFHHSTSLSYTLPAGAFTDPDGDALTYSMAMADGSPLPHWISLVGRELTVGNSSIREPFYDVVITATDPSGVQVSSSMTLHLTLDGALPTVSSTSITLAADQHHAVLSGTDALNATGNSLSNKLVGNSAANELRGLDGDDELNGRGGADTLWGGQGNDVYYVDHAGDLVIELAGEGHADLVISTIGYTLPDHVEQLSLLTHAHVNLTGNALNNKLTGQQGDNLLDGREGADTLRGYGGNDTYVIDNAGDTITELANEGTLDVAQLWTSFSFLALSANRGAAIERIEVMGNDALSATGNGKGQQIVGNGAANELRGGGGADTILGQGGDDRLILGTAERASLGTSSYEGGEGLDTLALASDQNGVFLDFTAYGANSFTGIERVDLTGGGNNTAKLTIEQLLHMPDAGEDKLIVLGNAGDAVQLAGGPGNWSSQGMQSWQGIDYSVYSHSGAVGRELFVQQGITVM